MAPGFEKLVCLPKSHPHSYAINCPNARAQSLRRHTTFSCNCGRPCNHLDTQLWRCSLGSAGGSRGLATCGCAYVGGLCDRPILDTVRCQGGANLGRTLWMRPRGARSLPCCRCSSDVVGPGVETSQFQQVLMTLGPSSWHFSNEAGTVFSCHLSSFLTLTWSLLDPWLGSA